MASSNPVAIAPEKLAKLKRLNVIAGVFHLIQGITILVLTNDFALPVFGKYLQGPPAPGVPFDEVELFSIPVGIAVATFSLLSAAAHLWVAFPGFKKYAADLSRNQNISRWVEYSISSTLMIVLIGMLNSIWDAVSLIGLIGANVSMILFGWLQEKYEEPGKGSLLPFWFGSIAGIVPWLAMLFVTIAPGSDAEPPAFVYGIVISLFIFFNSFALVQWLQYKKIGRFADYLVGERTYIVLSFVAKTALAWQIFGGVLATAAL